MHSDPALRTRAELRPGERLLWAGAPEPAAYGMQVGVPGAVMGAVWLAFVIFWGVAAISQEDGPSAWLLALFGAPFILAGLWMLTQPFWLQGEARRTAYAITSERALILEPRKMRSVAFGQMNVLERRDRPDGSGSLYFTEERVHGRKGRIRVRKVGFIAVRQVREVEAVLDRARRADVREHGRAEPPPPAAQRSTIPAAG